MSETWTSVELPVLDISQPLSPSALSSLSRACEEWGFFYITNHGVSKHLYRRLHSLSNQLFDLPYESKLKVGPSSSTKTYTPHFIASPFFESIRVSGPEFFASAKATVDVLFDEPPPEDVEKNEVEGLGMHTDMSCITIVYQDQIGGLQVRSKQGKWMNINPCEDTLVVNIGDLMHAWCNGKLRSSEHRVVLKRYVNRLSLAFFWCFEDEKRIFAPDEVVGLGNLRRYKPFICADYLKFRESSEEGKFEKVGFTVKDFAGN